MEDSQIRAAQSQIDAEMMRFDRETRAEEALREEYTAELSQAIEQQKWREVACICDLAGFDFEEWAKAKICEDSKFSGELTDALFFKHSIDAIECAKNIVDAIDFDDLTDARLNDEDERMSEDEYLGEL